MKTAAEINTKYIKVDTDRGPWLVPASSLEII